MSTCIPCMDGDHRNCGYGNRVNMLECRCDRRTPDCPGQVLQRSGYTFDQARAYDQAVTSAAPERIRLARRALVADGYFAEDEVGDDVAPRISELSSHLRERIRELEAQLPDVKPMRLRVLELPQRKIGEAIETPFCLVLDRCPEAKGALDAFGERARESGANAVFVFVGEVELP